MSDDDVLDFLITEAVAAKIQNEDKKAQEHAERKQWQKQAGSLRERLGH